MAEPIKNIVKITHAIKTDLKDIFLIIIFISPLGGMVKAFVNLPNFNSEGDTSQGLIKMPIP